MIFSTADFAETCDFDETCVYDRHLIKDYLETVLILALHGVHLSILCLVQKVSSPKLVLQNRNEPTYRPLLNRLKYVPFHQIILCHNCV